jgi:hypothetical protein
MKKFSIIQEASKRFYTGGNPFSNGHRSRDRGDGFLKSYHYMVDLDEIIYDESGKIIAIVEAKYQAESKKLGNILEQPTIQKGLLLHLCKILDCKLFVNLTSKNTFYRILSDNQYKEYTSKSFEEARNKYKTYKSDDMIYIEYRKQGDSYHIKSIVKRLEDNINMNLILSELVNRLNVPLIKVDDLGATIKFYKSNGPGGKFIDEVDSILNPTIVSDPIYRKNLEDKWEQIYKELGIWL